jgi:undecaprenyl diphosphate synthase
MINVIHWCLELGVPAISVYAFSIDNFKRSQDEVSSLMQLAEEKYKELAQVIKIFYRKLLQICLQLAACYRNR